MQLVDSHRRTIHKVRLQLTDMCNFRCFYCMPENMVFESPTNLLRAQEIWEISSSLYALGIDEIRVTGGEPTLRAEFNEILTKLAMIPWKKFGLTTNGLLLYEKLPLLKEINCKHINISLDSLDEKQFSRITRRPHFHKVMKSILTAVEMGFAVKINTVMARGFNDLEIIDFVKFSETTGVEVRFLELMRVGTSVADHEDKFISAQSIIEIIKTRFDLIPVSSSIDSTSFNFKTNAGAKIGFIASESQPFCGKCSRLRLSATGKLRSCLFSEAGIELRGLDPLDYPEILHQVMAMKPTGRLPYIEQTMNQIGG